MDVSKLLCGLLGRSLQAFYQALLIPQNACLVTPDSGYETKILRRTFLPGFVPLEMTVELVLADKAYQVLLVSFYMSGILRVIARVS